MARPQTPAGSTNSSWKLDRGTVVKAAIQFIGRDGAQGLTMQALAHDLGVGPMSLYRYVSGREDLLEAVVAELLEGVRHDLDEELASTWQGYLQTLAHAVRRIAVEHAPAFPLVGPGIRPLPGCVPHCSASTWSRTSCRPWPGTVSPTPRRSAPTARSAVSCWASCCSRRPPAVRRRPRWRCRSTRGTLGCPTRMARSTSAGGPLSPACGPCSARTAARTSSRCPWRSSWTDSR